MASGRDLSLVLTRDPNLRELNRRALAEPGVAATPVVEHFDVVEQVGDGLRAPRMALVVHALRAGLPCSMDQSQTK